MGQDRYLSIYLNDHLAGAAAGVELARRMVAGNRGSPELREPLERVCAEIEADRETLERVMESLTVRRSTVKPAAGWLLEKLGRLKLNGQLRGYSPLSRVVELEGLCLGISGKIELWRALEQALGAEWSGFDFRQLGERAERQRATVEELHGAAVIPTFSAGPYSSRS
ncbi:MAG TPA: hypothetical protein VID51_08340 [Solirubrobacterales bacterium]